MEDTNRFNEYKQLTLPYQRVANGTASQARGQQTSSQRLTPATPAPQRPKPTKMPKAKALMILREMKRGIVIASFLSFGGFSALIMSHTVGAATQQAKEVTVTTPKATTTTATPKATTTTPKATATTTPKATATAQQGGGYGFGTSTTTSNPVSGTQTS